MSDRTDDLSRLLDAIRETRFAMFTTRGGDRLRSRPMTVLDVSDEGSVWFLGARDSDVVAEAAADPRVGLVFADPDDGTYAYVEGNAQLRDDPDRVKELWDPMAEAWFEGPDDPSIQLIVVRIESGEYWDTPDNGAFRLLGVVKAAVIGDREAAGEHGEVTVGF